MQYETTGVVAKTEDGLGHMVSAAPSLDSGYSLPGMITPGGQTNLATMLTYASSWQVTSVMGPNGAPARATLPDAVRSPYKLASRIT